MKSNVEWKFWGKWDPLYGVSSVAGKGRLAGTPWTDEEFYSRSQPEWEMMLKQWRSYGLDTSSCVEIGCGAGRMTTCLQKTFSRIDACDVSEGMIEYAGKHCDPRIVTLHLTDGRSLPLADESVASGFSTIVFQHFHSPADGLLYFRELHRVLQKGGTFMINVPLYHLPNGIGSSLLPIAYRLTVALDSSIAFLKRTVVRSGPKVMNTRIGRRLGAHMHSTRYEFQWLYQSLLDLGFEDIQVWTAQISTEDRCHDFVLGRKALST